MKSRLAKEWPFLDPQQVAAARAQLARGEFQTVETILDELQRQNSPADQG
jgi:hypothetical protein